MTTELERELMRVTGGSVMLIGPVLHATTEDWYEAIGTVTDQDRLLASLRTMPDYGGVPIPEDSLVRFLVGMMAGVM